MKRENNMDDKLLKRFMTKKVAVHLETISEWNEFMRLLEKETDATWAWGENPTENSNLWNLYGNDTCIDYCGNLTYAPKSFYEYDGYKIIEFKDLIKKRRETNMGNYNKNLFDRFLAGIAVVHVKTHDEYDPIS